MRARITAIHPEDAFASEGTLAAKDETVPPLPIVGLVGELEVTSESKVAGKGWYAANFDPEEELWLPSVFFAAIQYEEVTDA